jgi:hypothetical protein
VAIANQTFPPLPFYPHVFPGWAAAFVIYYPENVVLGHRVTFTERNAQVIEVLKDGKRTAGLLVPPPERKPATPAGRPQ